MTITAFDRQTLRVLRNDLDVAIQAVARMHGISLKAGHISFTPTTCSIKIEAAVTDATGKPVSKEAEDFKLYASMYGLKAEHLGKSVRIDGSMYEIAGIKPKAHKRPIILERADGRRVVASADMVIRLLAA